MLILLDRDGVLNHEPAGGFVRSPDELALMPGVGKAVARLNARGWPVAVCTNQSCIGRGIIDAAMLGRIHERLFDLLARDGAAIDALFFAPDPPWAPTERRKPGAGMLREAMQRFGAAPQETVFIGDNLIDLQAAHKAGCRRILVRTGKGAGVQAAGIPPELLPVTVAENLAEAVDRFLSEATEPTDS
jgi:D-glycero-D-manno-heptose 1,7-bisphosphate phosphatase